MTKSLMLSIQPKHLVNILNGYKTLELRKTVPKDFKGWVYIYCTKGIKDIKGRVYIYSTKSGGLLVDNTSWINYLIRNGLVEKDYTESPRFHTLKKLEEYMYGSVRNTKVVARFWFDEYEKITLQPISKNSIVCEYQSEKLSNYDLLLKTCLQEHEMVNYLEAKNGYIWHIKQLEIFDEPLSLSDFIVGLNYFGDIIPPTYKKLKRPPQSWQYIYKREK